MNYRITDLRHFVAISGSPTMTDAARTLGVSQPALSESLKRLEQDAGLLLFYRSKRGLQLTASGRIFLERSKEVLAALSNLDLSNNERQIFSGRTISIGCHAAVGRYSLPQALSLLKQKAPDFRIELHHDLSRNIQLAVLQGKIDIGIVINAVAFPDIVLIKLATDSTCVWAGAQEKNFDTVICNPLLNQTQAILRKWHRRPEKLITTESFELIGDMVAARLGYGIIPERVVSTLPHSLVKLDELPKFRDEIALIYRTEFGKSQAEKLVIACLKESLRTASPSKVRRDKSS